jgi:hypothetical protein
MAKCAPYPYGYSQFIPLYDYAECRTYYFWPITVHDSGEAGPVGNAVPQHESFIREQ